MRKQALDNKQVFRWSMIVWRTLRSLLMLYVWSLRSGRLQPDVRLAMLQRCVNVGLIITRTFAVNRINNVVPTLHFFGCEATYMQHDRPTFVMPWWWHWLLATRCVAAKLCRCYCDVTLNTGQEQQINNHSEPVRSRFPDRHVVWRFRLVGWGANGLAVHRKMLSLGGSWWCN